MQLPHISTNLKDALSESTMNNKLNLLTFIDKGKLDDMLKGFTEVSGLAAIITEVDGHPITEAHNFTSFCRYYCRSTEKGRNACYRSDSFGGVMAKSLQKAHVYKCLNSGLNDCAAPIIVGGYHLANFLCGQVRDKDICEEDAIQRARLIGIEDTEGYLTALYKVPSMSSIRLLDIANFMSVMTQTISELALQKYQLEKRSKLYLNKLINSVDDTIITLNSDAHIITVNTSCARMFGHNVKDLRGQSIMKLFIDNTSSKEFEQQMGNRTEVCKFTSLTAVKADYSPFPVQVTLSRMNEQDRKDADFVIVIRDITEEKKIERMQQDLVAMLTHDLANPVLAIQKTLQIILDRNLGALTVAQNELLEMSYATNNQLFGMVSNLLDIYRRDNGQFILQNNQCFMDDMISNSITTLNIFALEKNISLRYVTNHKSIKLYGDNNRLTRVFINLIANAIRYSNDGSIIKITTCLISRDRNQFATITDTDIINRLRKVKKYIHSTIEDDGFGIPEEFQQAIFEKFFTVQPRKGDGRRGLGLGLAFCKLVVEAHGGVIFVVSPSNKEMNRGCQFHFILPAI
jgi:PAS domain S-box-containing protein